MKSKDKTFKYSKWIGTWVLLVLMSLETHAQRGRAYEFLNLPYTARITALGGYGVPSFDHDLGMALYFPSQLHPELHQTLALNYVQYLADINYGTAAYARTFDKVGILSFSVQYVHYGNFLETDEFGNTYGDFTASDYALQIGWGRMLSERFSIGSNIKFITSVLESYSSIGVAADISASYYNPENEFVSAISFRNIGRQLSYYYQDNEPLPFEIIFSASKKLANAPLRFSLVAHNLQRYDLTWEDPFTAETINFATSIESGLTAQERFSQTADKILRHAIIGAEILPSENFTLSLAYNYRRRQEMDTGVRFSATGFSWGLGIKRAGFLFQYGRSRYHLAGAPNHFSVTTNLDNLFF